jgi:hypothetical protein
MKNSRFHVLLALVCSLLISTSAWAAAVTIVIINKDAALTGFNDPTAAAPVGGNPGTTVGAQRLNVFTDAANIWASKLATLTATPLTIRIAANFQPLTPCSVSSGVIGSAGPLGFWANFTNAPKANTWYAVALASALSGTDLSVGANSDNAAISASFNSNVGTAGCLSSSHWYYGLDAAEVGNDIDLEATLLHEFGHGLGFLTTTDYFTGSTDLPSDQPDVFNWFMLDTSLALHWNVMSDAQRLASMTHTTFNVFDGPTTVANAATVLAAGKDGSGRPLLFFPNPIQQGSTASHFDTSATPNQIMEPVINHDLSHNVDVPSDLTTSVFRDLGWPAPSSLAIPTNLAVTSATSTTVNLSWSSSVGATSYHVYRSNDGTNYTQQGGNIPCCVYADAASTGKAYLYKVRAFNGSSESGDSNKDLAYAFTFTDPTITVISTKIKAAHITELRTAVAAVRSQLMALGTTTFATDPTITALTTKLKAAHIAEIRAFIDAARTALGVPANSYTNTPVALTSIVKKVDITDLRNAVQ